MVTETTKSGVLLVTGLHQSKVIRVASPMKPLGNDVVPTVTCLISRHPRTKIENDFGY